VQKKGGGGGALHEDLLNVSLLWLLALLSRIRTDR